MSKELSTGIEYAACRAAFKAMGLTDEEISKPVIAVVTAFNQADPCGASLDAVTSAVADGIRANGGTPLTVPCLSPCGGLMASGGAHYALPMRELIADGIESALSAYAFDGAVLVTGNEESVAGMLMGAVRVNIPSIAVAGGPMLSGTVNGSKRGIADVHETAGAIKNGKASIAELNALESGACFGYGSYNGMYTTNALNCVCEALGLSLPCNGSIPALNPERIKLGKRTGEAIIKLVNNDVRPRMILNKDAMYNAFAINAAMCANTDVLLHLFALAAEYETNPKNLPTLDTVAAISDSVPALCNIDGRNYDMQDFYLSGGVQAVMNQLNKKGLIKPDCITVGGQSIGKQCEGCEISGDAIKPIESPLFPVGGIGVLKGNIADEGAVIKRNTVNKQVFVGKAKCFDSQEECYRAIAAGGVKAGDVLVIRHEGPMGGPGMSEMLDIYSTLSKDLLNDVAVITDGRLSGISAGWMVGHICPEAAAGGKLAYVKNGDKITIDVKGGRLNVDITAKELQARIKKYRPHDDEPTGWLLRYKYAVTTAALGCVLKKKF